MLKIGRCGIDVALDDPEAWNISGPQVELSGWMQAASVDDAMTLRQQLLGYVDSRDEPAVPVTWSEDSTNDGWYYVTDAEVDTTPVSLTTGWFAFSVTLVRVGGVAGGYSYTQLQSTLVGKLRTNTSAVTTGDNWHAFPTAALDYYRSPGASSFNTRAAYPTATGVSYMVKSAVSAADTTPANFVLRPTSAYAAAATLSINPPSLSGLRVAVGRQIPAVGAWVVSNGLVQVDSNMAIASTNAAGTALGSTRSFGLFENTTGVNSITPGSGVTVLRNSPELVAIRIPGFLGAPGSPWVAGRVNVDISLRRGDRLVQITISSDTAKKWGINGAAGAGTAVTGGVRKTANDSDGHRTIVLSPQTATADLANTGLLLGTAATRFTFGIGYEVNGSSAAAFDAAAALISQFFFVNSERQSVVGR